MFKRLQKKWNVNGYQLVLVLCTFALGGSLCGFFTREIITTLHIENDFLYGTLYFIILTLLWPLCVIGISIPLGQFTFFKNYLSKMAARLGMGRYEPEQTFPMSQTSDQLIHLGIFASGRGTNARKIMEHFQHHPRIKVNLLVSNKPGAGALHHAADFGVSTLIIDRDRFFGTDAYVPELQAAHIDYIILAGFLWKVPEALVAAYPQKIINIHPALLPKFGGKGMYGKHVHEAVIAAGENESGITIHFVDEQYDHGATIFQATCPVPENDSPDALAERIHALEHAHFAEVIEQTILQQHA
ncbi:MAG TPA: phosphoribosylglycinamide formyltransferase [Phnomibacter sp.]|nr:phosphoribosylglycinamide formyltransferase [Phnomibacter sp.]